MDALTKIAAVLALLAALFYGEQYIEGRGYDRRAAEDSAAMEKQKGEAKDKLAELTKDKLAAMAALSNLKNELEKTRETLQSKNAADLRARIAGPRLQFAAPRAIGCGGGGSGSTSPAPGPAADAITAVIQLPEPLDGDIRRYAADAESLAIDYGVLYRFVNNPQLVCELRP